MKVEIGPGPRPRANREPETEWFLIEKGALGRTMQNLQPEAKITGMSDEGFFGLRIVPDGSAQEILLVDVLTDWDRMHVPVWKHTKDMELLAHEAKRILAPGGCVTIVEVSDPAPVEKIIPYFAREGLIAGEPHQYVSDYIKFSHPNQYMLKFWHSSLT